MKLSPVRPRAAFTLLEVFVVIVMLVVLGAVILPRFARVRDCGNAGGRCVNNLKNVGFAFRIFAEDNGGKPPWEVSTNQNGTAEFNTDVSVPVPGGIGESAYASQSAGSAWVHFAALSNELSTPKILVCPADIQRRIAPTFFAMLRTSGFLGNSAVSYFIGLSANEETPQTILSGDRNLTTNGVAAGPGRLVITTNTTFGFTAELHRRSGNVLLGDGSVQPMNGAWRLTSVESKSATNVWLVP